MAEVISISFIIMELMSFFLFCECFLQRKKWTMFTHVIILATICFVFWNSNYYKGSIPTVLLTLTAYYVMSFFCYKGQWQKRILATLMSIIMLAVMDTTVMYLWSALLRISIDEFTQREYAYITAGVVSKLSSLLISWLVFRCLSKTSEQQLQIRWLLLILLFPAISLVVLMILVTNYRYESDMSLKALGVTVIIALANIGTMYMITIVEKSEKEAQRVALLSQQMNIQTQSFLDLEKSYRSQRAISHDYISHLNALRVLLDERQYEIADHYIRELQKQHTTRVFVVNAHNPVVDAVLNQKYQVAKEHEIDMLIKINDLSAIKIPTESIVVVLSNLLDNAIEACGCFSGDKVIQFSLIFEDKLILSIRNTTNPVFIVNGVPKTTKPDKKNHGYGLQNVERILDDLKAEHVWHYQNNWFSFVAEIPMLEC